MNHQPLRERAYVQHVEAASASRTHNHKPFLGSRAKGLVSMGLGAALLIGGGGTLAYWNETVSLAGAEIVTGNLDLAVGAGVWTLNGSAVADVATVKLVPGDVLQLTQPVAVVLDGDNIAAVLKVGVGAAALPTGISAEYTYDGSAIPAVGHKFTGATDTTSNQKNVVATFTFDSATTGRTSVDTAVLLDTIDVTLQQTV